MLQRAVALRTQALALSQREPAQGQAPGPEAKTSQDEEAAWPAVDAGDQSRPVQAKLLLGAGGASALGAVGAGLWWRNRQQAQDRCEAWASTCLNADQIERQRRAAIGVTTTLSLAAVGLVAGGATLLMRERKASASLWMDVGPRHGSATLRWSF
jgi:hypothetical protein